MRNVHRQAPGFTLLELVIGLAIVAILGMIAIVGYQQYVQRAKAADLVLKYDAIRSGVGADLSSGTGACADLAARLGTANLANEYARLAYGFEAVTGGYRPVLNVCAKADANGALGVKVARGAYDTLAATGKVEPKPVLGDTVVSFSLRLSDSNKPLCTVAVASARDVCGDPVAVPVASAKAPALAQGATPTPAPNAVRAPQLDPAAIAAAVQAIPAVQALPQADKQVVTAAAQQMAADPAYAKAVADAIASAPAGQPVGVPASAQALSDFTARCPATRLGPPWPAEDKILGGCPANFLSACNQCVPATTCPVSCGLTKGIGPDVQKALDASWRDVQRQNCVAQYGAADPRCRSTN